MSDSVVVLTLAAAVGAGTPLVYAALGELIAERSGVLNLGVEGMMLLGAVACFLGAEASGSVFLGVLFAAMAGGMLAGVHAIVAVSLRANQIVSGLALVILGTGAAVFIGQGVEGVPLRVRLNGAGVPGLGDLPVVGSVLFQQDALVYLSWLVVLVVALYFANTKWGLVHRAVGENPSASDIMGARVVLIRYLSTVCGGILAGIGGAYVILAQVPNWSRGDTTGGLGWIAIALVVFAGWHPWRVLIGAYLFGLALRAGFAIQAAGYSGVPASVLAMLPYLLTIAVMIAMSIGAIRERLAMPAALGVPYVRGER